MFFKLESPALKAPKIHPAREYFLGLQRVAPSAQLSLYLSRYNTAKTIDSKTFAEGVKQFTQIANSNPLSQSEQSRQALFGNIYSGLHYSNDLIQLWNSTHSDAVALKTADMIKLAPPSWEYVLQDGFLTIIYKGQQPAEALDELIKGPTIIDCGMFTQLSLWFGIRYMLGNERFNYCFGRAPFFITQHVYQEIKDSSKPHDGNPLFSFLAIPKRATHSGVTVKNITNSPLYSLKHPGGGYGSENCIVIDNLYYIFDPHSKNTQGLKQSEVLNILHQAFDEDQSPRDLERLALYAETPEMMHPKFGLTFGKLINTAKELCSKKLTKEGFLEIKQDPSLELIFDLHLFSTWLNRIEYRAEPQLQYAPQPIHQSLIPNELLNAIPFENKMVDFSKFKQNLPQQKKLMTISTQFCHSVMTKESRLVILSGKAGVGKTASAVCAAKELTARNKKIVWVSEVMVKGWSEKARDITELENSRLAIDNLLATAPDAVFLDDDNLAGFCGQLLLEKLYFWYVTNPGKGLFITSNEPIVFKKCYGYKLDGYYHYPPFSPYHSHQYLNWIHTINLAGDSLRAKRQGQSIGAVVSDSVWDANKDKLGELELVPAFDSEKELCPIRLALINTGSKECAAYKSLRPVQQRWLHTFKVSGYWENGSYIDAHLAICSSPFEQSKYKTIAVEIRVDNCYGHITIQDDCMEQLIRVLNYAHDQGGMRVILINQTHFSSELLLEQIKKELPTEEKERSWSRLMLLLCETESSIFQYSQFNGRHKAGEYAVEVLANTTPMLPSLIQLIMNYALDLFDFWSAPCYQSANQPVSKRTISTTALAEPSNRTIVLSPMLIIMLKAWVALKQPTTLPSLELLDSQGQTTTKLTPMKTSVATDNASKKAEVTMVLPLPAFFHKSANFETIPFDESLRGTILR